MVTMKEWDQNNNVSSPAPDLVDLTVTDQTDRTHVGRPLASSATPWSKPFHLPDAPCSLLFPLIVFH